jgi:EAL domain-containing protein (putative c-di-GMP-specific phosphodiesterase class I)
MNIVAEGVETFEELAYLQTATSIRQVQGFYFSSISMILRRRLDITFLRPAKA